MVFLSEFIKQLQAIYDEHGEASVTVLKSTTTYQSGEWAKSWDHPQLRHVGLHRFDGGPLVEITPMSANPPDASDT